MMLLPFVISPLDIWTDLTLDAQTLSSIAIIAGAIFVVFQLRDDKKLIEASIRQANASSDQARLSTEQLKQNYELATVDLVTKIYDQANSLEVQNSWLTVINTKVSSFEEFEKLPEAKQLAYYQIASLFESVGLLVEKGYVNHELIDDMFATQLAWDSLYSFIMGMRKKFVTEDYYFFFQKLHERLSGQRKENAVPKALSES